MATTSSHDANAELARRYPEDVATTGDLDLIDDLCTADVVDHSPLGELQGRDALKEQMATLRGAFSDFSATVDDVLVDGDSVAMRVTLRGTHDGEFMGHEPTGLSFEVSNMVFTRIEDGRIAERWVVPDLLGLFSQVGIVESPLQAR